MTTGGNPPVVLTIAGSDSGSGAGIQADIKTMAALGVFATTAVTAVTAQNTTEVREVHHVPVGIVTSQIRAVIDDLPVAAVKTGLLGTAAVVEAVGDLAASGHLPRLVVDPVMVASTGRALVADRCVEAYRSRLLPHALLVTPNLWEAALLAGVPASGVGDLDTMVEVARRIHRLGPTWVLVKGGHLPGVEPGSTAEVPDAVADVLFDGREVIVLDGPLRRYQQQPRDRMLAVGRRRRPPGPWCRRPDGRRRGQDLRARRPPRRGDLEPRAGTWTTRPSRVVRWCSRRHHRPGLSPGT